MQFDDMLSGSSEVTLITGDGSRWVGLQVQVLVPGVYIIRFAKNMINSPLPPPQKKWISRRIYTPEQERQVEVGCEVIKYLLAFIDPEIVLQK